VFTEPLCRNALHNPVVPPLLGADDVENIYCCGLDRVYRAVAWKRVDQIRYNIKTGVKETRCEGVDWFQPSKPVISGGTMQVWKIFGFPEMQTNFLPSTFISLATRMRDNSVIKTQLSNVSKMWQISAISERRQQTKNNRS
jgi:hypothetical protein